MITASPLTRTAEIKTGTTTLGVVSLVSGSASLPESFAAAGSYPITAVYSGDANYPTTTSAVLTQIVNAFSATNSLTSSVNPSFVNQSATFTATIAAASGQTNPPAPTGTVTFKNGTTTLATVTLVAGTASTPYTFTATGSYPITAVYSGDANYAASTSTTLTQVVVDYGATLNLTSSVNPSGVGQSTTFTAAVNPGTGQGTPPTPTGTVTFKSGTTTLGTVTLVSGGANLAQIFTTIGSYNITATYSGDTNYPALTSSTLVQVVGKIATTSTLTVTPNPAFLGQALTLTANVTPSVTTTPADVLTGSVTFYSGTTALGTVPLQSTGNAIYTFAASTLGTDTFTCVYSGDNNNLTSSCAAVTDTVSEYASTGTLASAPNPSVISQSVGITATLAPVAGQNGAPAIGAGNIVTFFNNGTQIGTATTNAAGVATFNTPNLPVGNNVLTCTYTVANFTGTTCAPITQVVTLLGTSVNLASSANPVFINNQTTLTALVAPLTGQNVSAQPTGTVTFMLGTTALGTAPLIAGQATLNTSFLYVGSLPLTAVYNGDANFAASTSPLITEVVEDLSLAVATGSSSTATVFGGYTTTYTFTLAPVGGTALPGPVTLSLSGAPTGTAVVFSPMVVPTGNGSTMVTLTVKPPPLPQAHLDPAHRPGSIARMAPVALALLALPFLFRRRRRGPASLFLWVLLFASAVGLTGCVTDASSGYYGNNPQTSTLTVTGTAGTLTHSTNLALIVQ